MRTVWNPLWRLTSAPLESVARADVVASGFLTGLPAGVMVMVIVDVVVDVTVVVETAIFSPATAVVLSALARLESVCRDEVVTPPTEAGQEGETTASGCDSVELFSKKIWPLPAVVDSAPTPSAVAEELLPEPALDISVALGELAEPVALGELGEPVAPVKSRAAGEGRVLVAVELTVPFLERWLAEAEALIAEAVLLAYLPSRPAFVELGRR